MSLFTLPLHAVSWSSHAPTVIFDADGVVLAECGGFGRDSAIDVKFAASIVASINSEAELLEALRGIAAKLEWITEPRLRNWKDVCQRMAGEAALAVSKAERK